MVGLVWPPGLRLPLLGEWTTSFVSRMDMLALVVQQVLVSLFIFGPTNSFVFSFLLLLSTVFCVCTFDRTFRRNTFRANGRRERGESTINGKG